MAFQFTKVAYSTEASDDIEQAARQNPFTLMVKAAPANQFRLALYDSINNIYFVTPDLIP